MLRAVVLRHELPDGSHHYDWLIEPTPGEDAQERALVAWRLAVGPEGAYGTVEGVRMPAHRRAYLDYEGPISGGRGLVRRVGAGEARVGLNTREVFEGWVRFDTRWLRLSARVVSDPVWSIRFAAADDPCEAGPHRTRRT